MRHRLIPRSILWLFCSIFAVIPCANATTIAHMTEAQLIEHSSLIVRGRVLRKQSKWNPQRTAIITQVQFQVHQEVLGRPTPSVVVIGHYGGQVGNERMGLPNGPNFTVGEEIVVFLHTSKHLPGEYLLTGWTQGIWNISRPELEISPYSSTPPKAFIYRSIPSQMLYYPSKLKHKYQVNQNTTAQTLQSFIGRLQQTWKQLQLKRKAKASAQVLKSKQVQNKPVQK